MKRVVVIVLMLVYGLSSTGATVHLHFCCGKLDNISFNSTHQISCSKKFVADKRCCDTKHVELKVKADQEPGLKWVSLHKDFIKLPFISSYYEFTSTRETPVNEYPTGPPLNASAIPLFIQHCVYRI